MNTKTIRSGTLEDWVKTRKGGFFVLILTAFILVGSLLTFVALIAAVISGSSRLAVAGTFASGIASFFGLAAISAALIANYVLANRDTRDAEDAWTKKLRLEEALAFYPGLVITAVKDYASEHPQDTQFSAIGLHPIVKEARLIMQHTIREVRETGLPRVLSLLSNKRQVDDLGELLLILEANIVNDIATSNPGLGQSVAILLSQTSLLDELPSIGYDEICRNWNQPWSKLAEAKVVATRLVG